MVKVTEKGAGGFVAGTLVHTKEGLKPIEEIRVGDWVLSKPDSGEGEQAYKRVTRTFVREAQELLLVQYWIPGEMVARALVVTASHPFWKERWGWTSVHNLMGGDDLQLHNADIASVFRVMTIFETETPGVGWSGGRDTGRHNYDEGPTVDLRNGEVKVSQPGEDDYGEYGEGLNQRVYNLEVEDFHTYYVGELGIWVHNCNRGSESFETLTAGETPW